MEKPLWENKPIGNNTGNSQEFALQDTFIFLRNGVPLTASLAALKSSAGGVETRFHAAQCPARHAWACVT